MDLWWVIRGADAGEMRRCQWTPVAAAIVTLIASVVPARAVASTSVQVTASPGGVAGVAAAAVTRREIYVDPVNGRDSAGGGPATPVRTVAEAWRRVPQERTLAQPTWIQLRRGTYPEANTPHYWESRWGTAAAPLVINAVDGARTAVLRGDINAYDVRHLTLRGLAIDRAGDTFHCEKCGYVTLRGVRLNGRGAAHETVKVNQSHHLTITGSDISGSYENAIDFVAVQHATISGNVIHHADDWCAYVKGGSAYVNVRNNRIHHCGTGGFTAGQGTGFEYMVAPWLRYETYGVTVMGNVIHDTQGAGLGINGGYNTVMAYNTLYRVGARSHTVEFVHGSRSCDGETARCAANRRAGGWGGVAMDGQYIPSRHTYFLNNVIMNPAGYRSQWQQVQLAGPVTPPAGSGVPAPSRVDTDLVIRGNVFSNGSVSMPTGLAGARDAAFLRENAVNSLVPDLVNPAGGDFRPVPGGRLTKRAAAALPTMTWADAGVPAGAPVTMFADHPIGALR